MILSVLLFATFADGLMFYLNPGQAKCFSDEFAYDVLVNGDYRVVTPNQDSKSLKLSVRVVWLLLLFLNFLLSFLIYFILSLCILFFKKNKHKRPAGCNSERVNDRTTHVCTATSQITDSEGNIAFENKMVQGGKFGFTTAVAGEYKFCMLDYW
jgi:hypothetical protein